MMRNFSEKSLAFIYKNGLSNYGHWGHNWYLFVQVNKQIFKANPPLIKIATLSKFSYPLLEEYYSGPA